MSLITKRIFFIIFSAIFISSCISGNEDRDYQVMSFDNFPLEEQNIWVYDIVRGNESYTDSAVVIERKFYQSDELGGLFLYVFKDPAQTQYLLNDDTLRVKLIRNDGMELRQYGREKRDGYQPFFSFGEAELFEEPVILLDIFNYTMNTLHDSEHNKIRSISAGTMDVSGLRLVRDGYDRVLNDTLISYIKIRHTQTSALSTVPDSDLFHYYTDLGIIKTEGTVGNAEYRANAKRITINKKESK